MEFSGPTFFKFPTNTQTHSGTFAVCQAVQETCTFCVYECYSKNLNLWFIFCLEKLVRFDPTVKSPEYDSRYDLVWTASIENLD